MNFLQLLRKQKGKVPHQRGSEKMCDVCDTTLWHWSKKNYLKPQKVGNKVRYRQSDIQKILGGHNPLI